MSETLTKVVIDCSTGEEKIELLSPQELAQREADLIAFQESEAARLAAEETRAALKASAKAKLIAGQPLTAEEAEVLVI